VCQFPSPTLIMRYSSKTETETQNIAREIAENAHGGEVYLLTGELGAGKTTFAKGFLSALGVNTSDVVSPTFTLMQVYDVEGEIKMLIHIDTYRMKNTDEFLEIGALDYVGRPDTVTVIEWPELVIDNLIGLKTIPISIEKMNEDERVISIE
jgi:tRNA threonylcarbamoyladenosine biosynthesis protein TsaE